ncbi:MAG: M1 family metallopeptidase [Bacteroidota bacterium]|nr:M1 family metallopeptidase [Bacteroidota bacterium]MDP4253906.1 M1 family metallopeptidase [Bacteroidota bacterium]MDP4259924.1 M1 family metallopeptidase [Bacteroidota bacterium]
MMNQNHKRLGLALIGLLPAAMLIAQPSNDAENDAWKKVYRASATRVNDLVNTRLDVKFDYAKSWMYGKEWVTLTPHFYPTDSLALDAKGMDLHQVAIVRGSTRTPLKYDYDGMILKIHLDRLYRRGERYTLFIDYTSKPNDLKVQGSAAITDAKGLYFINPLGQEKDKPTEIWTQGETEANSAWFPTIDKPNQKTTEEITMTVPAKYVTLSNGTLLSQKTNGDGTRTDHWKMDLPHAPYLFFMGVGDFTIVTDHYKGKEVSYYVEKEYGPVARRIFGLTPEMIAFYSRITGVDFPWPKYAQIVGRDYVSGAMENTTSTLHAENAQQDARELTDGNGWEDVIAHELFHQWFGDLVTCESWSNITLNESFADYSETLWNEYKYGKDAGDAINFAGIQSYLGQPNNASKDLVRFYYADKEDVFDGVSYPKGGRILNMLRNYVGDSAFFQSLHLYLTTNKFKSAEAQQLRLAFEEVTGQDLNWYWNQWYYGSGHPKLSIDYAYDDAARQVKVIVNQTQETGKIFRLPIAIDVYNGASKERHKVWIQDKTDTFTFGYANRPDLVNVDGDKVLLCEKKDNKTLDNFIHQYKYGGLYLDRREAIDFCGKNQDDPKAVELLTAALGDRFFKLRNYALNRLDLKKDAVKSAVESRLADLAAHDPSRVVKAKAIELLGRYYNKPEYKTLFVQACADSSYTVAGNALDALTKTDSAAALGMARRMVDQPAKGKLVTSISTVLSKYGDESSIDMVTENFAKMPVSQAKFQFMQPYADMLGKVNNVEKVKKGIDLIVKFRDAIPKTVRNQTDPFINNILNGIASKKQASGQQEQADYIKSKMAEKEKTPASGSN